MKVFTKGKDSKEVKDATVIYDTAGNPVLVREKGVDYDISKYDLREAEPKKKTRQASEDVMTTKNVRKKS